MNTYERLYEFGKKRAVFTAWLMSDGHCPNMEEQIRRLDILLGDFDRLGRPADMIWYLGDAVCGDGAACAAYQIEAFDRLGIPLCYVTGNHDYDRVFGKRGENPIELPFSGAVRRHPGWYTTASEEDTWFKVKVHNTMVYFFSDHMASDGSWIANNNRILCGHERYPYRREHFDAIRHDMEQCGAKHIITASHYPFPGGNREDGRGLLSLLQPLPRTVRLHLYGHSHIGKYSNEERTYSQIQWVNWQDIPQVDIASMGGAYGQNNRSAYLQMYEDDSVGIFFRHCVRGEFYAAFFPSNASAEPEDGYRRYAVPVEEDKILLTMKENRS